MASEKVRLGKHPDVIDSDLLIIPIPGSLRSSPDMINFLVDGFSEAYASLVPVIEHVDDTRISFRIMREMESDAHRVKINKGWAAFSSKRSKGEHLKSAD